ncbi:Aste57867_10300 [Aphanomyces stellatus]|uniref:Aste57867_10300 protein n=1 Tax=Aphanomyces stellatus TaxID=120398 RepID=A0A485KPZ1_9STRA|nr:hypothetical protein As57867_010260 [Aphanomyces stellatus]VFT87174.1 Aste57867_10300 [Aphanomyces stellatus]
MHCGGLLDHQLGQTKVTLTPVCAADLSKLYSAYYGNYWYYYSAYRTTTNWYSVVQGLVLSPYSTLTSYFCGSLDCIQLTMNSASWLSDCNSNSSENVYVTATNLLANCAAQDPLIKNTTLGRSVHTQTPFPPVYTPTTTVAPFLPSGQTCDQSIMAINQQVLVGYCPFPGFAFQPTLAALAIEYTSNPASGVNYDICGTPLCLSSLASFVAMYPRCTPDKAISYYATLNALLTSCPKLLNAIATQSSSCTLASYANYSWVKNAATLSANCAAALTPFGYAGLTRWYSIAQAVALTQSNAPTSAFCGSTDCVRDSKTYQLIN